MFISTRSKKRNISTGGRRAYPNHKSCEVTAVKSTTSVVAESAIFQSLSAVLQNGGLKLVK